MNKTDTIDHDPLIRRCYELAKTAVSRGNHPFGAVLTKGSKTLAVAENTVTTSNDCTCHAELNLVRKVQQELDKATVAECTLYSSTEPCAMCAGAIYWAGIRKVVYGCSARRLRDIAGESLSITCREVFAGSREPVEVIGPILEEEGTELHQAFWSQRGTEIV